MLSNNKFRAFEEYSITGDISDFGNWRKNGLFTEYGTLYERDTSSITGLEVELIDLGDAGFDLEATAVGNDDRGGDDLRHRARRLLELGDETISNALSHNSERFLEQNRQQGGE